MTECFELIDRKLLKGPWVMGEQYTICDPGMAASYSADEKAELLSARRTQNHGSILYSAFSTKSLSALPVAAVGPGSTVMLTLPVAWSPNWSCSV
jgi:hypothetical protein